MTADLAQRHHFKSSRIAAIRKALREQAAAGGSGHDRLLAFQGANEIARNKDDAVAASVVRLKPASRLAQGSVSRQCHDPERCAAAAALRPSVRRRLSK